MRSLRADALEETPRLEGWVPSGTELRRQPESVRITPRGLVRRFGGGDGPAGTFPFPDERQELSLRASIASGPSVAGAAINLLTGQQIADDYGPSGP